jgi:hypothetical protein
LPISNRKSKIDTVHIKAKSQEDQGTKFTITLPKNNSRKRQLNTNQTATRLQNNPQKRLDPAVNSQYHTDDGLWSGIIEM